MGCDIHCHAERRVGDTWVNVLMDTEPLAHRSYRIFGFLAGVRNYSAIPTIAEPRGFPDDASAEATKDYESWDGDAHTPSWLTMEELSAFNYDAEMEDCRYRRLEPYGWNGGATCDPGKGKKMPWREFLGEWFMAELERLKDAGIERLVFWFDS